MERYLLGIDIGTTGTKTLLLTENGRLIRRAYRAYPLMTKRVGYSEQNAEDWWAAVRESVREACRAPGSTEHIAAVALSVQGGTVVPVDGCGNALRPAIVWNDQRCTEEREEFLREVGGPDDMYQTTGWMLGNGMPVLAIRWLRKHEPEIFKKTAMFQTVPDYIAARMTGIAAVDLSNLGINHLGNVRRGCYDSKLLDFAGITEDRLPRIVRSGDVIGRLTKESAEDLGLHPDVVLVAGAHDQYAAAVGAGAIQNGNTLIGSGTSWVVMAIGDAPAFESGLAQSVSAVPGKWGSLSSLSSGGVCLDWLRQNVCCGEAGDELTYERINAEAAAREAAREGLFFFPFTGCATREKKFEKGAFVGLDLSHDRFHMARAVMEGVAFQIVWKMQSFHVCDRERGIIMAGGAGKSRLWCQMVADIAGIPVRVPLVPDLACVGAAIIAGVGSGVFDGYEEGCRRMLVEDRRIMPDQKSHREFLALMQKYMHMAAKLGEGYEL